MAGSTVAQVPELIEEHQRAIKKASHDTIKVVHYNELSKLFCSSAPDSAMMYALKALTLSEKNEYRRGEALAFANFGLINNIKGD